MDKTSLWLSYAQLALDPNYHYEVNRGQSSSLKSREESDIFQKEKFWERFILWAPTVPKESFWNFLVFSISLAQRLPIIAPKYDLLAQNRTEEYLKSENFQKTKILV